MNLHLLFLVCTDDTYYFFIHLFIYFFSFLLLSHVGFYLKPTPTFMGLKSFAVAVLFISELPMLQLD